MSTLQSLISEKLSKGQNLTDLPDKEVARGALEVYSKTEVDAAIAAVNGAYNVAWADINGKPTTIAGYGITDAYTKTEIDQALDLKADQSDVNLKADKDSPALTGTPTAPTAISSTNNTQIATTAFVQALVAALIGGAPGILDTFGEVAAKLADNDDAVATIMSSLNDKLGKTEKAADSTLFDGQNAAFYRSADNINGLAAVAKSGQYSDLSGLPAFQYSDWDAQLSAVTPGDLSIQYVNQNGFWFRFGPICFYNSDIGFIPTYTTASGLLYVSNLPFSPDPNNNIAATGAAHAGGGSGALTDLNWLANVVLGQHSALGGGDGIIFPVRFASQTQKNLLITDIPSGGANSTIRFSGWYVIG